VQQIPRFPSGQHAAFTVAVGNSEPIASAVLFGIDCAVQLLPAHSCVAVQLTHIGNHGAFLGPTVLC
jgi:hypothetical protein